MLKWLSGDEGAPGSTGSPHPPHPPPPSSPLGAPVDEVSERLSHTEQLVSQLKELIREKDAALKAKDEQLKAEKETCEAKLSKLRLQNKAKVTSLNSQLEELKKSGAPSPTHSKKGDSGEQAARGKVVLLKKKVEDLEQALSQRDQELQAKKEEVESWFRRGEEIDQMLAEKDVKLAEKEAYIVHLQTAMGGEQPTAPPTEDSGSMVDLQNLVQNLTKKIGEMEERYSLLQEQTESFRELLSTEQEEFTKKEDMYKQNIQTFKDILLQKDQQLMEMNQKHEQELFKLAAKSDASADLEQLLKALKQKLHEKEEVLLGKNQVVDVLQGEVDTRDAQIKELMERLKRMQVEQKSLESKMEAERHVMKAQIKDLMDKHQSELKKIQQETQEEISQSQQDLQRRLQETQAPGRPEGGRPEGGRPEGGRPEGGRPERTIAQLEAKVKEKVEEATKSEAKFLKIKAWSKSRIKQLEDELRKNQPGCVSLDLSSLQSHVSALEAERQENQHKLDQYEELRTINERLMAKLVVYEEQQRSLQADLEQFTKRGTSQASESGSADDPSAQVLEWQEMVAEAVSARDRAAEEKSAMTIRISHLEEEKEALASRHQELEEELAQSRGLSPTKGSKKSRRAERSLQEDFEEDAALFPPQHSAALVVESEEGENMGGGLRSLVEELELERNQLQEQILSLEEHCQDLEDRLQLQARIETLQNETERLQGQLANVRGQQSREAEKHQLLVSSLNLQLKGLSETQESLESSLLEKENSLAETSEKLEVVSDLREALRLKENQTRETSERLLQTESKLEEVSVKCSSSEKRCSELKSEVGDLSQKLTALREKALKQESTIESLQTELDQTNEELDKINSLHLEERAQLIQDLQSCERHMDQLKDALCDRDKELCSLSAHITEYAEQVHQLKQELKLKEETLVRAESALQKAERDVMVLRDSQTSDQQDLNTRISDMMEKTKDLDSELAKAKEERDANLKEVELLVKQTDTDKKLILDLRSEVQRQTSAHNNHVSECEAQLKSLKEKLSSADSELEELKVYKEEKNRLLTDVDQLQTQIQTLTEDAKGKERGMQEETARSKLEMQERDSENHKLKSELQSKVENVSKLKNALKNSKAEKVQLQEKIVSLAQGFESEKGDLNQEVQDLQEERSKLEKDLSEHLGTISELNNDISHLDAKMREVDAAYSENTSTVEKLLKENNDLKSQTDEMRKVLEQSTQSNSEMLLSKTKECTKLSLVLRETQEELEQLQETADALGLKVQHLQREVSDKDVCISELRTHFDELQLREKQLGEALSRMEQHEARLESELSQKEVVLEDNKAECLRLESKLEGDLEALTFENTKLCEQREESERKWKSLTHAFDEQKEELDNATSLAQSLQVQTVSLESELVSRREEMESLQKEMESKNLELSQGLELQNQLRAQVGSLEEELERKTLEINALNLEKKSFRDQIVSDKAVVEGLVKEKESITLTITQLNRALNENEMLNSEKTSECVRLLREKENHVGSLQSETDNLKAETERLNTALSDSNNRHLQLEDTVSMLREQGGVLKAALMEKDAMLTQKMNEITQQNEALSALRRDVDVLREDAQKQTNDQEQNEQRLKEANKELQSHKEELNERNETVVALSTQLGAKNELESELSSFKADVEQRNAKIVDLEDGIQILKEQNSTLKKELLRSVTELQTLKGDVESYKASVREGEAKMASLSNELKMDGERRSLTEQDHENIMKQQQDLIQTVNQKLGQRELELKQKTSENEKLVQQVFVLEKSIGEFQLKVEGLVSESEVLRAALESKEQSTLQMTNAVESLSLNLQNKTTECESLKERVSSLEEATSKLQAQISQTQKASEEKEMVVLEQSKTINTLQSREGEAEMYRSQFSESTELVSKLQEECTGLRKETEETHSAFKNLQDKYATHLEELQDVKNVLAQKDEMVLSLQKLLEEGTREHQSEIERLKGQLSELSQQLETSKRASAKRIKEKDQALASHQGNVAKLTVEIDRLKTQHVQVAQQMDALTGNIEQREMALHAINNQYAAQAKHATNLAAQIQILEEQNAKLQEKHIELEFVGQENVKLQEQVRRLDSEKADLETKWRRVEESKVQSERESGLAMETLTSENGILQTKVSAQNHDMSLLKENVVKLEQILQDSEKEWLLVLDKEQQDTRAMSEQLQSVENETKCKDVKVTALKEDLHKLQEKLAEAVLAVSRGSEQLLVKEQEASMSKQKLENMLALIREKDDVNNRLQQSFDAVESELRTLTGRTDQAEDPKDKSLYLLGLVKDLEQSYTCEIDGLKNSLDDAVSKLKTMENVVEKGDFEKCQQISSLQEALNQVQTRLDAEADKVQTAAEKYASLYRDVQAKEEHMSCMEVQVVQQKELLSALSIQLKEKDSSVAQVIEAAANERVRSTDTINDLKERVETLQKELKTVTEKLQSEVHSADVEAKNAIEEIKTELAKSVKEKDAVKKKLQASLVVRKELMKKIEIYENEEIVSYKNQLSQLNERLENGQKSCIEKDLEVEESKAKLNGFELEIQTLKAAIIDTDLCLSEKESSLQLLQTQLMEKENGFEQEKGSLNMEIVRLEAENTSLKTRIDDKEVIVLDAVQKLNEKDTDIKQIQETMTLLQQEKSDLLQRLEGVENEIKAEKECASAAASSEFESEVALLKKEKATLQKKAKAAMLARKETMKKSQDTENKLVQELAELKEHSAKLTLQSDELKAVKDSLEAEVVELKGLAEERELLTLEKENQLQHVWKELETMKTQMNDLLLSRSNEVQTLTQQVEEKDRTVTKLKLLLEETEGQHQTLSREKSEMVMLRDKLDQAYSNELEALKQDVQEKERSLADLKRSLAEKDGQCSSLQSGLDQLQAQVNDVSMSYTKELELSKQAVEERDICLQELKLLLDAKESQCGTLANAQSDLDRLSSEMVRKDEDLVALKVQVDELESRLKHTNYELMEAQKRTENVKIIEEKLETLQRQRLMEAEEGDRVLNEEIKVSLERNEELKVELETALGRAAQKSTDVLTMQNKLDEMQQLLKNKDGLCTELELVQQNCEQMQRKFEILKQDQANGLEMVEEYNKEVALLKTQLLEAEKQSAGEKANFDMLKSEKDKVIAQKSMEIVEMTKCLEEMQEDKNIINTKLEETSLKCAELSWDLELTRKEKVKVLGSVDQLKEEIMRLSESQMQTTELKDQLKEKQAAILEIQDQLKEKDAAILEIQDQLKEKDAAILEIQDQLKEKDAAILEIQDQLKEKDAAILEIQDQLKERDAAILENQVQLSEKKEFIATLEAQLEQQVKMCDAAGDKSNIEKMELQTSNETASKIKNLESKVLQLAKRLQAALLSRKELLKDNAKFKEDLQIIATKYEAKEADCQDLESSNMTLKQQHSGLESSLEVLRQEKESILLDNRSLSAACESLKQTIENITQQKQAFSYQLEALKDSETEELTKWKGKHDELKQEYESLLQAYENVSSEMDKMRLLLEGAKRDRQEAVRNNHKLEVDLENLEKQLRDLEVQNEKLRDGMNRFTADRNGKMTELEEESKRIGQLEDENSRLLGLIDDFKRKVEALEVEKLGWVESINKVNISLEGTQLEGKSNAERMQNKLDEALSLNNSLTVRIEAQKTELGALTEINQMLQNEKRNLCEKYEKMQNEHDMELSNREEAIKQLNEYIAQNARETISLNEKVRILEDDKCLLQEELENSQETSDKVKNENEYLETVILKNSEKIDELTESIGTMQTQSAQLSSQLTSIKEMSDKIRQEKEQEQIKLVKEFEEKLRKMQRGNEGSKNFKKELQELLKDKHQEINILQQNCIKYQEVALNLERTLKTSQQESEKSNKELQLHLEQTSVLEKRLDQLQSELTSSKSLLNDAKEKISEFQSERSQLVAQLEQSKRREQEKMSKNIEEVELFVEKNVLLQQIEDLKMFSDGESHKLLELQRKVDTQELQMKTYKRDAETKEAKLTALVSSARGGDAAKVWDDSFQKALGEKDDQLLEQGFAIKRFLEEMRMKDKELNELRVTKAKLERTVNEYSVAAAAHQRQLFVMSASNAELNEVQEMLTRQASELTAQVERLERDRNTLNKQAVDKEDAISQVQLKLEQIEKLYSDSEAQLNSLQDQNDHFYAEFDKQEGITRQLKSILQSKNSEISSLLSCKDGQMSGYLEQIQANYQSQMSVYEDRLTSARYQREKSTKEMRSLEAKVKSLQIQVGKAVQEKNVTMSKMESFKNSLVSLQNEREKLMSDYKVLEAKNQTELSAKTGEGAAKGLKHEIRKLLHQMDDLNSENAMLRAQLVRYREDLNQVLSLKDNQLKILLKKQQETIKMLENDKMASEKNVRNAGLDLEKKQEVNETLNEEISQLKSQILRLEHDRKEITTTNEGKVIFDLQNAVVAKAAECSDLQHKLITEKHSSDEMKRKCRNIENETDAKLAEAEDKYNSELDHFEREVILMRNEKETSDQRASDLEKESLELQQQLSEARNQSKDFKEKDESLCKAMAALQNDRDQLIQDFKVLRNRNEEELRESQTSLKKMERKFTHSTSESAALAKRRDVLAHKLKALEGKDQNEMSRLVDELGKALSDKEGEVTRVRLENESYVRQLSAFSKSMASLQNDRDQLMEELSGARREVAPPIDQRRALQLETKELEVKCQINDAEVGVHISREEMTPLRSEQKNLDLSPPNTVDVSFLETERARLHQDLQQCVFEIQRRDQYIHQLAFKLQQLEQDTSLRQQQGALYPEEAPGAPQDRSREESIQLSERLQELEQSLCEERMRREAAEEALNTAEEKLLQSGPRDFSIDMEPEDEWDALSLDPTQPLLTRKVRGSALSCARWLRGRSLYFSTLLRSRTRAPYVFMLYLLSVHLLLLLLLSGAL